MKILSRVWNRLYLRSLLRRQSAAQKMAKEWQKEASRLLGLLKEEKRQLEKIMMRFENRVALATTAIENIEEQVTKHDKALDALRNENEVMSDVTIPALTAACKLGQERWDAEAAIQVRRQVAALPSSKDEKLI